MCYKTAYYNMVNAWLFFNSWGNYWVERSECLKCPWGLSSECVEVLYVVVDSIIWVHSLLFNSWINEDHKFLFLGSIYEHIEHIPILPYKLPSSQQSTILRKLLLDKDVKLSAAAFGTVHPRLDLVNLDLVKYSI